MKEFRTEADIDKASREELCAFLLAHSDDYYEITDDINEETLRDDAHHTLEEMIEDGQIVYTFDELSQDAKYKVIYWLAPDYDWWQDSLDYFKEMAKERGLSLDEFKWFGAREGTSWSGDVYLNEWLAATYTEDKDAFKRMVFETLVANDNIWGRYTVGDTWRSGTHLVGFEYDFETTPNIEVEGLFMGANALELVEGLGSTYSAVMWELEEEILESCKDLCSEIAKVLSDEEDWYQTEEYAKEMCEANDYVFDSKGRFTYKPDPVDTLSTTDSQLPLALETSGA